MYKKKLIILTPLLLAACSNSSGVFRTGENQYEISTRATWELGGRAGAKKMALEEATAHCQKEGKRLNLLNQSEGYGHFEGGTIDLQFSCE
ncbi:hypothetical protein NG896_09525 [Aeromonas veronii]|uniref:hypothetical protein n=1 Tax=Aeromonas TaxID=642 RepID=UPI0019201754|nr:hypothetical protein [Aeromonas veronii]MBL0464063.1 hypothetical protein [Aeromonas veronii]MCO5342812.1 hypothetical protein [Aeromonas veronii]HDT6077952.1 hypothetical protein [Aeromonas veronii bv. veronii]